MSQEKGIQTSFTSLTSAVHSQFIRLMRAEIEQLKTMKSIDQAIQSQVKELALARSEALQLRQEIQVQSDCMREGVKKIPVRKIC